MIQQRLKTEGKSDESGEATAGNVGGPKEAGSDAWGVALGLPPVGQPPPP